MRTLKFDEDGVPRQVSRQAILDSLPPEKIEEILMDASQRHLLKDVYSEEDESLGTCSIRKRIPEAEQYFAYNWMANQTRNRIFPEAILIEREEVNEVRKELKATIQEIDKEAPRLERQAA